MWLNYDQANKVLEVKHVDYRTQQGDYAISHLYDVIFPLSFLAFSGLLLRLPTPGYMYSRASSMLN